MGNHLTIDTQDIPDGRTYEYRARLEWEESGMVDSPRDDECNGARLVLSHRNYNLPNEDDTGQLAEAAERGGYRLAARYLSVVHDAVVVPVWGYDHGTLTFRAGTRIGAYADQWDSGLAGLAYCTREWARDNLTVPEGQTLDDVIASMIAGEVQRYSDWGSGDVFGYIAERRVIVDEDDRDDDDDWEHIDSCWGFIGDDREYAMGEAVAACESQRAEDDADETEIDDMRMAEVGR